VTKGYRTGQSSLTTLTMNGFTKNTKHGFHSWEWSNLAWRSSTCLTIYFCILPATFNDILIESFPNLCTFPPTSADEIRQIIASLKCKTTSNSYDIPAKFLKVSASSLSSWLSEFFNKCMAKGEFPNLLQIAQITPIPKITSPKSPND